MEKTHISELINQGIDWSGLPSLVLSLVADKLNHLTAFARFGAVCSSWRAVYDDNRDHILRDPLLLMIPDEDDEDVKHGFSTASMRKGCTKTSDCQFHTTNSVLVSSHGWLALVSLNYEVRLLNPLLSENNEIKLPPMIDWDNPPLIDYEGEVYEDDDIEGEEPRYWFGNLRKVVLSADPSSNPNYTAVALHGGCNILSFYKPGDEAWTSLGLELGLKYMADIIYDNDKFYLLQYNSFLRDTLGQIFACDLNGHSPVVSMVAPKNNYDDQKYIVKSDSDLLQVIRTLDLDEVIKAPGINEYYYYTRVFLVLKFDHDNGEWNEVKTLNGRILFLGDNSSVSLSTSDMPGCKPNCIYFTDDYHGGYFDEPDIGPHDMGVFSLEDGSFEFFKLENGSILFFDMQDNGIHRMKSGMIGPAPIMIQPSPR